jgi:hypothetical protein
MIKLSSILKEIKTAQKAAIKTAIQTTSSKSMQLFVVEDVLSSGAFNKIESIALREFFVYRKSTPMLNENTVQMINKEMLREGFFDWIKDKATKFKDALSSGWDKLKAAWANFKEFVVSIVTQLKEAVKQTFTEAVAKMKAAFNWSKDIATEANNMIQDNKQKAYVAIVEKIAKLKGKKKEEIHTSVPKELTVFKEQKDHIVNFVQNKIVTLEDFSEKAVKGETNGTPDLEESIGLFKDKRLVETLIQINESELDHPEDVLKKWPKLSKVVKVIINILKWTFGIFGTLIAKLGEKIAKGAFGIINSVSNFLKGPVETGGYLACAALFGEFAEIVGHKLSSLHEIVDSLIVWTSRIIVGLVPILLPYVKLIATVFRVIGMFFFIYAIVTAIMNTIIPAFKAIAAWADKNPDMFKNPSI